MIDSEEQYEAELDRLTGLSDFEYLRQADDSAYKLKVSRSALDKQIRSRKSARTKAEREAAKAAETAKKNATRESEFANAIHLDIGSDAEVAGLVVNDIANAGGLEHPYVYTEGVFYQWQDKLWQELTEHEIESEFCLHYDGAYYLNSDKMSRVRFGRAKMDSVMSFVTASMLKKEFFQPICGVNCQNGFVEFDKKGEYKLVSHHPGQFQRTILSGEYTPGNGKLPRGTLLRTFFDNMFRDDPEALAKIMLIQEVFGSALTGYATHLRQPKAIVLHGRTANNGKSALLDLMERLSGSCSSVPADGFKNENTVVQLRGHKLNTASELSNAKSIESDLFKKIITGDAITGKVLYEDVMSFRPLAQHVFATNKLPSFMGGIDIGVRRRLIVLDFIEAIKEEDMIADISVRILAEEYDLLLSWGIEGAARLIRNGAFTMPDSSRQALTKWTEDVDSVAAWVAERVRDSGRDHIGYRPSEAYGLFVEWAEASGYLKMRLPGPPEFRERMAELFKGCRRTAKNNRFRGITIHTKDIHIDDESAEDIYGLVKRMADEQVIH